MSKPEEFRKLTDIFSEQELADIFIRVDQRTCGGESKEQAYLTYSRNCLEEIQKAVYEKMGLKGEILGADNHE